MRPDPAALMLFAAGLGTRMGALTRDRPKPLIPVAGRALIDHALALASGAGVARIVVNTHAHAALLRAHLQGRGVLLSHEPELLDTGGGLRAALPLLGAGPVATLNSDAVWTGPNPLRTLRQAWRAMAQPDAALLLLVPARRVHGRQGGGDFALDGAGRLSRGGDLVYTGAQILPSGALDGMPPGAFSLNLVWDALAAQGRLFGTLHPGHWADVGHPAGIAAAEAMLARHGKDR